jgi:hypothetical protein
MPHLAGSPAPVLGIAFWGERGLVPESLCQLYVPENRGPAIGLIFCFKESL